jgi:hypothetical protein
MVDTPGMPDVIPVVSACTRGSCRIVGQLQFRLLPSLAQTWHIWYPHLRTLQGYIQVQHAPRTCLCQLPYELVSFREWVR